MWPAVNYDLTNQPTILFTSRTTNSRGMQVGDGPSDMLMSACFGGGGPPVVAPLALSGQPPTRAHEPKVRCDSQNRQVAMWRGFQGKGRYGFCGDVAMNIREGGNPTCGNWGGTYYLTDDQVTDWQVDFDIDQSNMIRTVYVKKGASNPLGQFGDGYDGIYMIAQGQGPDLNVNSEDISFSNDTPAAGEEITITAIVHNGGNDRAFGPFWVSFAVDGAIVGQKSVNFMEYLSTATVQQTWVSDGLIHDVTVTVDPTFVVAETNETNNSAGREIGRPPAPVNLQAYASPVTGKIDLNWSYDGTASEYRVLRSTTQGTDYVEVGATVETRYTDTDVQLDTPYYYVVRAVDLNQNESNDSNEAEANIGPDTDSDGIPDIADPDADGDGLPNWWENANGLDWLNPSDAVLDPDDDDFPNNEEYSAGTDPHDPNSHPDIVPPSTPVVTAPLFGTSTTQLAASWTCSDEYSGISNYDYSIGTFPGGNDVIAWTSNGTSDELLAAGLSLANGSTYYISVRATDGSGNNSEVGVSSGTTIDTTAPSITTGPTVAPWTPETSVAASWYAEDAQSAIENYGYSIGSSPGATDIAGWTDVGLMLSMNRSGLSLSNGQLVYVNVRATNRAGLQTTLSSGPVRAVKTPVTIGQALALADDTWIVLQDQTVSGSIGDYRWIESSDRSAAFRLETSLAADEGQNITLVGQIGTPVYTRQIVPEYIETESAGNTIRPVGMKNISVGGSARNSYTRGVDGGVGLNNVALLITTWGVVTSVGTNYFYVDDGSGLLDTTGNRGVRVNTEGLTNPSTGQYVVVTGLVNATRYGTRSIRLLIPRRQDDIQVFGATMLPSSVGHGTAHQIDEVKP